MAEIDRRRSVLERDIAAMNSELAELGSLTSLNGQAAIAASAQKGGRPKGSGRKRGANGQSLATVLQSVLRGNTMNVAQMAEAAVKAGYKSSSKNFKTVIGLTLLKNKKLYKRVSRGQYTAR